jgi:ATP-dependent Clp protease ATP-binding subunit ClpB
MRELYDLCDRFDEIILLRTLTEEETMQAVDLLLLQLQNLVTSQGLELSPIPEDCRNLIAQVGYDPGARSLRNEVNKHFTNVIAIQIHSGVYVSGDVIVVEITSGAISLRSLRETAEEANQNVQEKVDQPARQATVISLFPRRR